MILRIEGHHRFSSSLFLVPLFSTLFHHWSLVKIKVRAWSSLPFICKSACIPKKIFNTFWVLHDLVFLFAGRREGKPIYVPDKAWSGGLIKDDITSMFTLSSCIPRKALAEKQRVVRKACSVYAWVCLARIS